MNARTHFTCTIEGCAEPHDARGMCRSHYSAWRRHGDPLMRKIGPRGLGWLSAKGYRMRMVDGKKKPEHVLVAEQALGRPLPRGACVHHLDENPLNNAPTNLVICPSNKYHRLIHQRLDAFKACGNYEWRKCPYCRRYDDPARMRAEQSGRYVHAACSASARRTAYARRNMA